MHEDQKNDQPNVPLQPNSVITPGAAPAPLPLQPAAPAPQALPTQPVPVQQAPATVPQPLVNAEPALPEQPTQEPAERGAYAREDFPSISWTASEFVAHEKSASWYLGLAVVTLMAAVLAYFFTKGFISPAVIIVAAIIMGYYAEHKPRQLQYQLDMRGLSIEGKLYPYEDFKSFTIVPEGGFSAINFMPLKRFSPVLTVYYAPDDAEKISEVLLGQLPYEEPRHDAVDNLMKRIRF